MFRKSRAIAIVFVTFVAPASAEEWYHAITCTVGSCTFYHCALSDTSPSQVYENSKWRNAKLTEYENGRVDVTTADSDRALFVYFRTREACNALNSELQRRQYGSQEK